MPSYTAAICGSEVLLGGVDGVIRLSLSAEKLTSAAIMVRTAEQTYFLKPKMCLNKTEKKSLTKGGRVNEVETNWLRS